MKIWYDACTGKHIRYGSVIAKWFRRFGFDVILTTRRHPDTIALAKLMRENFLIIGEYAPESLFSRLQENLKRSNQLAELFRDNTPDIAISHQSVDLCRVAFGLGIPIILTADTPYATAVNKLTIPLANHIVASEAIPKFFFKNYGVSEITQFKGVDEVAWIKDFTPELSYDLKKPLIVIRQMETKASYALGKSDVTAKIIEKLSSLGNVFFLNRYNKLTINGLIDDTDIVDSVRLVSQADLVVGVGGTIGREAALLGVPSIVISDFGKTYVNSYLSNKGFPLFEINLSDLISIAKKYLGKRWNVQRKFLKLENPLESLNKTVEKTLKTKMLFNE